MGKGHIDLWLKLPLRKSHSLRILCKGAFHGSQCRNGAVGLFHCHQHLCGPPSHPEAKRNALRISQSIVSKSLAPLGQNWHQHKPDIWRVHEENVLLNLLLILICNLHNRSEIPCTNKWDHLTLLSGYFKLKRVPF